MLREKDLLLSGDGRGEDVRDEPAVERGAAVRRASFPTRIGQKHWLLGCVLEMTEAEFLTPSRTVWRACRRLT